MANNKDVWKDLLEAYEYAESLDDSTELHEAAWDVVIALLKLYNAQQSDWENEVGIEELEMYFT